MEKIGDGSTLPHHLSLKDKRAVKIERKFKKARTITPVEWIYSAKEIKL